MIYTEEDFPAIRASLDAILDVVDPSSITALQQAVAEGRIDGSNYLVGVPTVHRHRLDPATACGCIKGHLLMAEDVSIDELEQTIEQYLYESDLEVDQHLVESYIEEIDPGDTPETSPILANVARWIEEYTTVPPEERR